MCSAVAWAAEGCGDPVLDGGDPALARPDEDSDRDASIGRRIVTSWLDAFGREETPTVREVVARVLAPPALAPLRARALEDLRDALVDLVGRPLDAGINVALGKRLETIVGKAYPRGEGGRMMLRHAGKTRAGVRQYDAAVTP